MKAQLAGGNYGKPIIIIIIIIVISIIITVVIVMVLFLLFIVMVHSSEFYFHKPITVHIELYLCYHFIHFLQSVGQY